MPIELLHTLILDRINAPELTEAELAFFLQQQLQQNAGQLWEDL